MMSRHVIMGHSTYAGVSVTQFMSRSWQLPFASANDGASPAHYNCIKGERN